jgi:Domain of unknown function (DUF4349)
MRWLLGTLIALGLLTGCTAGDSSAPQPGMGADLAAESVAAPGTAPAPQVIITGNIALEVDDPATVAESIREQAAAVGGMIESESASSDGQTRSRFLTVRIPAGEFERFFAEVSALGDVTSESVSRTDVTAQVVDLDAQIAALEPTVARLKELLNEATTIADVIAAETALAERQARLDGLLAQRKYLSQQVDMATLYVSLTNGASAAPTIALFFGGALIGAIIAGVIAVVIWTIRRR